MRIFSMQLSRITHLLFCILCILTCGNPAFQKQLHISSFRSLAKYSSLKIDKTRTRISTKSLEKYLKN